MRRNTKQIWTEILTLCKEPHLLTPIVYKCNLNFRTAHGYLDALIKKGCLEKSGKGYVTTARGLVALETLRNALEEIENI
jgi:predicted transcriptional regulator